jgi:hypothetical protein
MKTIKGLTDAELEECVKNDGVMIGENFINTSDMYITYAVGDSNDKEPEYEAAASGGVLVILNTKRDQNLEVSSMWRNSEYNCDMIYDVCIMIY